MIPIALRMLALNRARLAVTVGGIAFSFFLCASQVGLMVGWCNTCSAVIRHADADVWVMGQQTPAFDFGDAIPGHRLQQTRNVPGVARADAMFVAWVIWQRPDGQRVNVELIGLDDGLVGRPWRMQDGSPEVVFEPNTVVVDELYLHHLGVEGVGDEVEIFGRRAVVGGVSSDVRSITTNPLVFTSLGSTARYYQRYRNGEITYVLVKCAPGSTPDEVRDAIAASVPHVEVLTSREFARRTQLYWMLGTGIGITVIVTAILGLVVAGAIISQTLYAITLERLDNYATLAAVGFSPAQLAGIVLVQALALGSAGILLGTIGFVAATWASHRTQIPVETTPAVFTGLVVISMATCIGGSLVSIRSLARVDPVRVFRA
jgi:putative ABC transport system permease protein